ncbi:MAG: hypothetical protein HOK52_03775 [Candidatus Marinimicrobia bacterium]|jgi:2',3'-cyclic-nucleotide 2'-phosphodiesterase (5'-nucleotidase family)|nr:hypothetical protein [Candidatus Neomarinimicrobiota bacterium]MBT3961175.1 hypothetical protein [Candidatus Neomarinimicrobiota bacterium]MBT4382177.1 hypothetical protein [Candidatus Neomarinimicrobiota bacterium]MBT4635633.1 hypothetical protein [Candidatus Neomarinimicrobiota bacterium]MBT4685231.1 hypothetical protein [Candidatus Neomarinimicrobiota bacterium]
MITSFNRESQKYRAGIMLEGYEKIGCDALNVGYFELLLGKDFLMDKVNSTSVPFVSANLRSSETGKLLFPPYQIVERQNLTVGIVGLTTLVPDTLSGVKVSDHIVAGNNQIKELKDKVDLIVILINSDRKEHQKHPAEFPDADFIFVSGSNNRTRPHMPQKEGGPYLYSSGKQGKYMMVLDLDIKQYNTPIVDVSSHEEKIKSVNRRFERLQKKDPTKSLDELYKGQPNVMKLIVQYRQDIKDAEVALANSVNTMKFQSIALSKKIKDDPDMLSFVDTSLLTCTKLNKKIDYKVNPKKK